MARATLESTGQDRQPQWPKNLGTVGIFLAAVIFLDQLADLLVSGWAEEELGRALGSELGATVVDAMPPRAWLIVTALISPALAFLLLAGSLALRRERLRGVVLTRVWAWAAICWTLIGAAWGLWLSTRLEAGLPAVAVWQPSVLITILLTVGLLLVYPIFLLVWLARHDVEKQWMSWN